MLLAALLAGITLFASDHPLHWWPLQFVAFVPLWSALAAARAARQPPWLLGVTFGLGYAMPLLLVAGLSPPVLAVALANVGQWLLIATVAGRLLEIGPVRGALASAAVVTLVEVGMWHAVPVFGTAQTFVRPLSAVPALVAFVAFTGVGGLVFALTAAQALLAAALRGPRRLAPLLAASTLVAIAAVLDVVRWTRPLGATVRVAAFGWGRDPPATDRETMRAALDAAFAEAAAAGARLIVTPETGIHVRRREEVLDTLGGIARKHALSAAIGVWHEPTGDNRLWFLDAAGALRGEYCKSHLVPFVEDYAAGDGTLVTTSVGDVALGGMICQDDNFPDLARGYGRMALPLLAVPTNDWSAIRMFHFENSVFRSIENGYAVVRATSRGISAIVSPRGEVLARCDHVVDGPRLVVGEVPTGDGEVTQYARYGDWPILGLCAVLLAFVPLRLRRRAIS